MFKNFLICLSIGYGSDDKRIKEFSALNDEIILKSGSYDIDYKAIKI